MSGFVCVREGRFLMSLYEPFLCSDEWLNICLCGIVCSPNRYGSNEVRVGVHEVQVLHNV